MNNQFLVIGGLGVVAVSALGWWWWQNGQADPRQGRDTTLASSSGGREGGGHDIDPNGYGTYGGPGGGMILARFRPRSVTRRTNG